MLEGKTYRTKIQPVVVKRRYFVCIFYERGKAKIWVKLIHRQGFHLEYILVICKANENYYKYGDFKQHK